MVDYQSQAREKEAMLKQCSKSLDSGDDNDNEDSDVDSGFERMP